jgi:hypothetical protein
MLGKGDCYEVDLVNTMLDSFNSDDLLIFDRGYASYLFMANLIKKNVNFIIRCPKNNFISVMDMFNIDSPCSKVAIIKVPNRHVKQARELGLPSSIQVKLVKVILPSNEIEVLATSLIDKEKLNQQDFSLLYSLRWGVETFFGKIKGRLLLENFTGKSIKAVKQDFWSTIFISNLETIMTEDIEENLNSKLKEGQFKKSINKSISFNAIKNLAFELFYSESDKGQILKKLENLFTTNLGFKRSKRIELRKKISPTRSLNYQKRAKKQVF